MARARQASDEYDIYVAACQPATESYRLEAGGWTLVEGVAGTGRELAEIKRRHADAAARRSD